MTSWIVTTLIPPISMPFSDDYTQGRVEEDRALYYKLTHHPEHVPSPHLSALSWPLYLHLKALQSQFESSLYMTGKSEVLIVSHSE